MVPADDLRRWFEHPWLDDGLLVRPPIQLQGPSEMDQWRVFIRGTELGLQPTTREGLARDLSSVGLRSLMLVLADINQLLRVDGVANRELQARFLRDLAPKLGEHVARLPNLDKRVLFFPQQLLVLMKMALLHCPDHDDPRTDQPWRDTVVRMLLQVSDLLATAMPGNAGTPPSHDEMLRFHMQTFMLNRTEGYAHVIPRAWHIYTELACSPEFASHPDLVDVAAVFARATGLDLREYIALGFALLAHLIDRSVVRGNYNADQRGFNPRIYFDLPRLGEHGAQFLRALTLDYSTARQAIGNTSPETSRFLLDTLAFMRQPLYAIHSELTVPLHMPFVEARFTSGLYWTIADFLRGHERERFTRFFGRLFEAYVRNVFHRALPNRPPLTRRVIPDFPYQSRDGERRTSDVILCYPRTAVFIEATAGRLRFERSVLEGDLSAFDADLERLVLGKARQVHERIQDFRAGLFDLDGQPAAAFPRIIPIIVTPESLPEGSIFWNHLRGLLRQSGSLTADEIDDLQLIDVEELELLEPVLGAHDFVSILDQRRQQQARDASFKNFLLSTYIPGRNPFLVDAVGRLHRFTLQTFFGKDESGTPEGVR